jgi:hypothetical protein
MQTNKALVGLVIGLGAIILVGMGLLVYGFVQKASDPSFSFFSKTPAATVSKDKTRSGPANLTVQLPPGTSVVSIARADDLIMVHTVDEDDNSTLLYLDPMDGRIVRRIAFGGRR